MTRDVARRPLLVAYRPLGLGDLLTGVPALRALARAYPGHRRVLCAREPLAPLAELSGAIDEVVDTRPLEVPAAALHGMEVAVNLHGRGPQSHRALQAGRPGALIAFACRDAGHRGPVWIGEEHETARWCRLLEESGIPADAGDLDLPAPPWPPPPGWAGATLIHPGAASEARRWPARRWAQVAGSERRMGRQVVITGSEPERRLAEEVATLAGLPPRSVLAGRTDLRDLAALVAVADRVLCGDTGVAHLATAFGAPSVVLFGPTPPAAWGPPADRSRHVALWAGRRGDPHASRADPGLLAIGVEEVLSAVSRLPERVASA